RRTFTGTQQGEFMGMTATEYVYFKIWDGSLPTTLLGNDASNLILNLAE
ncbi:hypothetical protein LCGC14_1759770, partial [marine sediment metagenome]